MTPSRKRWPTKAKEAPSPHEVRLVLLDTNPVFQSPREYRIEPSGNSNSSFHVGAIVFKFIVIILFSYIFPHVINKVLQSNMFIQTS